MARVCYLSRYDHVLAVAVGSTEGVTRERTWGGRVPRQNHPAVQSAGERHSDTLAAIEVLRELPREYAAQLFIVRLRIEPLLIFPFLRLKVARLGFERAAHKGPGRAGRQHIK